MVFLLSHWEIHHWGTPFLREYVLWGVLEQTQGGIDPMFFWQNNTKHIWYIYIYICMYAFYEYNWECTQKWRRFHSDVAWVSDVDIGLSRLGWALGNEWNLVILITLNEWNCDNGDFVIMGNTVVSTGKLVILITTTSPIDNNNQLDDTGDFVTWWF